MTSPTGPFSRRSQWSLWSTFFGVALTAAACSDASNPPPVAGEGPSTNDAGADTAPVPTPTTDAAGHDGASADAGGNDGASAEASDAADAGSLQPSICTYAGGAEIPYDHTLGIVEEFALELYSSCDLGGYLAPLVDADPVNLTEVAKFNAALVDWYRARILGCAGSTTTAPDGSLLLLPLGAADQVSRGDVKGVVKLYMMVLKRHDGMPDGYDAPKANEVRKRLMDLEPTAARKATDTFSKPSTDPGCTPSNPDGG